ncbi:MAG TPA: Maf family protein [Jatrophihabitantaceae bacterium]|nr:Maf family protein [Jatrophihabitantaceae bacterium]
MRFVLASQSPGRLRTLRDAGVRPEVIVSGVDEDAIAAQAQGIDDSATGTVVQRLAEAKAGAVAVQLDGAALVLGCDSMLDLDGVAMGKPGDAEAAAGRWQAMRGRTGTLWTGHCLVDRATGRSAGRAVPTTVRFADVSDAEIELYCSTGEPNRVAGAFTIDGLGGWFIDAIEGDHHNVVGLSLPVLREMLIELGYTLADLGYPTG